MNIAKNMEAIFVVAIALIGATSLAGAAVPAHRVAHGASVLAATDLHVVTVTHKRLSAAEKAQLVD